MATIGRKNVHGKGGVRFKAGYDSSKRKNMMRNVLTDLIIHGQVTVTAAVAKDLKSMADRMVTYGKKGDLAAIRQAARFVRDVYVDDKEEVTALQKLFREIAPSYKDRQGGYTRVLKVENRRGDNAPMAIVAFVK